MSLRLLNADIKINLDALNTLFKDSKSLQNLIVESTLINICNLKDLVPEVYYYYNSLFACLSEYFLLWKDEGVAPYTTGFPVPVNSPSLFTICLFITKRNSIHYTA